MRFISTRTHGVLDYVMGALLIVAPWLLGFARGGPETSVPVIIGAAVLVYSLFTRYELGLAKVIPMGTHLFLDLIGGAILAVSPWLFGFEELVWAPHLVFGLLEVGAALTTRTQPVTGEQSVSSSP